MKKVLFAILLTALVLTAGAQSAESVIKYDEMEIRKIAWDSIDEKSRTTIEHPMEQAAIELFGKEDERSAYLIKSS